MFLGTRLARRRAGTWRRMRDSNSRGLAPNTLSNTVDLRAPGAGTVRELRECSGRSVVNGTGRQRMRHKLSQDAGCEWVPCGKFGLNSRHEQRGLKRRPEGSVRIVLIPLVLV